MPPDSSAPAPQEAVAAMVAVGFNPVDATKWVTNATALVPPGADPQTWVPAPEGGAEVGPAEIMDARADWYVNAPTDYKMLLDNLARSGAKGV